MGTTTNFAFPFPEDDDAADIPADIEGLANDVDSKVMSRQAKKSIIATEQSRSSATYGYLGTEDKVTGIVMPTDGLIFVAFQALWKQSVSLAARAALFLNTNQVVIQRQNLGPSLTEARLSGTDWGVLSSGFSPSSDNHTQAGLVSGPGLGVFSDLATGQLIGNVNLDGAGAYYAAHGGGVPIFASAGTYEVGVQFRASSGSVTAKERKLWVWTMAFD